MVPICLGLAFRTKSTSPFENHLEEIHRISTTTTEEKVKGSKGKELRPHTQPQVRLPTLASSSPNSSSFCFRGVSSSSLLASVIWL